MTKARQQNINIAAGVDFSEGYTLKNADMSPVDMSGYTLSAYLAKHQQAINAVTSTSEDPVWRYTAFTTVITNPTGGEYAISMDETTTGALSEGKYVYSVVSDDGTGNTKEIACGLAFITKAFGNITFGSIQP